MYHLEYIDFNRYMTTTTNGGKNCTVENSIKILKQFASGEYGENPTMDNFTNLLSNTFNNLTFKSAEFLDDTYNSTIDTNQKIKYLKVLYSVTNCDYEIALCLHLKESKTGVNFSSGVIGENLKMYDSESSTSNIATTYTWSSVEEMYQNVYYSKYNLHIPCIVDDNNNLICLTKDDLSINFIDNYIIFAKTSSVQFYDIVSHIEYSQYTIKTTFFGVPNLKSNFAYCGKLVNINTMEQIDLNYVITSNTETEECYIDGKRCFKIYNIYYELE